MLRVEVSQQGHPSQTYHFQKHRVEVGRGANCDLVLTAPGISTIHAHIVFSEGRCLVIDQNSTNGTYLHGAPIHGPTKVMPYEAVYICSYCLHIEALPEEQKASQEPSPVSSEPPLIEPEPARTVKPTVPEMRAPAPKLQVKPKEALSQVTLPPKAEEPKGSSGAQRITVQPKLSRQDEGAPQEGIELRRWAVPAAPKHASEDQQGLASVFAALAQPFVERNKLPKGDDKSRASFYALAQAQLSVNLSPQSSQLGQGAERIVQALCGIGPLSELLRSGLLEQPGAELMAQPFAPLQYRSDATSRRWQAQDTTSLHPWALGFAAARLLGLASPPRQSIRFQRLSNGLQLTFIAAQDLQQGPMLMLHAPAAPAKSWANYCATKNLAPHIKALLEAAIDQGCPITVVDSESGADSLWNALQDYAIEKAALCHIAWNQGASLCARAINFCADESIRQQHRLCEQARSLSLAPIFAVDHPSASCLESLSPDPSMPTCWVRQQVSSLDQEPVLAAMQTQLKLQPAAKAGLCILVKASNTAHHIEQIHEYHAPADQPLQMQLLLERQADGQLLPKAPHDGTFQSNAAQRTFSVAPDL